MTEHLPEKTDAEYKQILSEVFAPGRHASISVGNRKIVKAADNNVQELDKKRKKYNKSYEIRSAERGLG